ncbi:3'-5' exonuclease [Neobacillus sp. YIM B02564]|uniref:3'-5' exonuclease n=1 Tax=Neobacillus paridis TaxID=2803862 RepID=A0ABS1TLY1_9BACI|nr:3'-5' exonuclease [Neobacillus paridis]MBL4952188.1 3'-5' exonuclease [Neobacillus paridis]
MKCPDCGRGVLRPIQSFLICNRFPVCRHKELNTHVQADPFKGKTYVVWDTETTGLSNSDQIIEIAGAKVVNGQIVDEFEALINPGFYINMRITEITGITNDDLRGKPSEQEIIPSFLEWLNGVDFLVAHNLPFDARMLKAACRRVGLPLFSGDGVCTLQIAKKLLPGQKSHKLGILCDYFGIPLINAHRAINDVRGTVKVFEKFKEQTQDIPMKPFQEFCKR